MRKHRGGQEVGLPQVFFLEVNRFSDNTPYLNRVGTCFHHPDLYVSPMALSVYDAIQSSFHRALAFAHDVELRLNPWYGRPRPGVADPNPASPPAKNAGATLLGTTWRGGYGANGSAGKPGGGSSGRNGDGDRENRQRRQGMGASLSAKKKDDLLACG